MADSRPYAGPGDLRALQQLAQEVWRADRRVVDAAALPAEPFDLIDSGLVCVLTIADESAAALATLAASRGVPLVLAVLPSDPTTAALLEELRRVTTVSDVRTPTHDLARLTDDQRAIVRGLAAGDTLTSIASELGMSRRTATRRLREARDALGVTTTVEALLLMRDLAADER